MNFGTPQEMIDEERNYLESIGKKPSIECLGTICYLLLVIFIGVLLF